VIRQFVLRSQSTARTLAQWMKRGPNAVLRVNSAAVLAKLGATPVGDEVTRILKADSDTRQLYPTAVAARVLELPWGNASNVAASVEQSRAWQGLSAERAGYFANKLATEITNPRDGAARWCSVVLLDLLRTAAPTVSSAALHIALQQEKDSENLRSIGAALAGDNPISY
jgi:hypothetical protein